MLRLWDHDSRRHRREFLQVGGLGLGGLQLTGLLTVKSGCRDAVVADRQR